MSISPLTLYYSPTEWDNAIMLAANSVSGYPPDNAQQRIDGSLWKATSDGFNWLRWYGFSINTDCKLRPNFMLLNNHNLQAKQVSLLCAQASDIFDNSNFDPSAWGSATVGGGTLVETTSLAATTSAANDVSFAYGLQSIDRSVTSDSMIYFKCTAVSGRATAFHLQFKASAPAGDTAANQDGRMCIEAYQDATGKVFFRYKDSGLTSHYFNGTSNTWTTTSTDYAYAGSLSTNYYINFSNTSASWTVALLDSGFSTLKASTSINWSSTYTTADPLWMLFGDSFNDAYYSTIIFSLALIERSYLFTNWTVPSGDAALITFAAPNNAKRIFQLEWNYAGTPAQIGMLQIGTAVILDYADAITPDDEEDKAVVNMSDGGIVQGIHQKYIERQIEVLFSDADTTLWDKVKTFRDVVGLGLFGVRWGDSALASTDVWMMRRKPGKFTAPLKVGGLYRDLKLSLIGKK